MTMLKGIDISTFQNPKNTPYDDYDFIMIRASYGIGYKDDMMDQHVKNALAKGKLIGFYHYCYPNLGTAAANEADWFISVIKPYIGKAVLALDYEGSAFNIANPDVWAKAFLDRVYEKTGVRPLLYASASFLPRFPKVQQANYGLWVAHWGVNEPSIKPWKFWTMWQYRGSPLDLDKFNGDKETWMQYADPSGSSKPVPQPAPKKSIDEVAKEIIAGKWGNGKTRFANLTAAGYSDAEQDAIQNRVNEILGEKKDNHIYYTVKSGDTFWGIGKKFGVDYRTIMRRNGYNSQTAKSLQVGTKLLIK